MTNRTFQSKKKVKHTKEKGLEVKGKILGAAAGAVIFQVIGAIVGLLLGHYLFDRTRKSPIDQAYTAFKKREKIFMHHALMLCAKMAKAKGTVNRYEIRFMEQLMLNQFKLNQDGRKHAIGVWNAAKNSDRTFEELALAFYAEFANERHHIVNMMDMLIGIAACDQTLHTKEEALLLKASAIFRVSRMQFDRIKGRHIHVPQQKWTLLDPHYAILGANPQDDLTTIKNKYRELAKKWHPDTIAARSSNKETIRHANKKFQEITEAYEEITRKRSAKS